MRLLFDDESFHFEMLRIIAHGRYGGSDVAEVFTAAGPVKVGDFESWYASFYDLAQRTENSVKSTSNLSKSQAVGAKDKLFAAANYYRAADFYLHGKPSDPRIRSLWEQQTNCFNKALALLGNGFRHTLQADGFEVPIIYYKAPGSGPHPTIILGNGVDGAQEEMLHISGFAALERGYNVITYEGPGQPSVRRYQNLGFINEWEKVVKPVVDFAVSQPEIDATRISLLGYSMGGYLCMRAAAFEHRIAAVLAVDGLYDMSNYETAMPEVYSLYTAGKRDAFNEKMAAVLASGKLPTSSQWGLEHAFWAFNKDNASKFFDAIRPWTLDGVIDKVECPAYIGAAEGDIFFKGQPEKVAKALGKQAHYRLYTNAEGAGAHCQVGAAVLLNDEIFDWLEDKTNKKT